MPLSPHAPREHLYARTIECRAYLRADGLWDIEGHLHDARMFASHVDFRGDIPAGAPFHVMSMRMTIDESMTIRAMEVAMDATPYRICPGVEANHARLVGLRLGAGFSRAALGLLGGADGCTHLREMLGPMATAAFQAVFNYRRRENRSEEPRARERLLDSCHALASHREVVKSRWPDAYTGG